MQVQFNDLKDKWALVLGASSGFGAAVSLRLAQAGMNICGVHLDRKATMDQVEILKSEILATGQKALFFNVNAADEEKRKDVLASLAQETKSVLLLFHSLAFGSLKPFFNPSDSLTKAQIEMTLDVMANSLVYWTQDCVSMNLLGQGSRVMAMTSAGSTRVWSSYGAVSAAKCALESHIRQIALELAPKGVSANAIRAGVTDTPALRKIPGNLEMIEIASKKNPFKRLTTPQDVANAVVSLCLPHCSWITGNVLGVDGGENIVE